MEVKYDWSNTAKIMFGFGYEINPTVTFMGGIESDQSPFDGSEMFTPHFIDLGSKLSISGGLQFHINQWDFGIAQIYTNHDDLTVSELTAMDQAGVSYNVPGNYKADTHETVLSFNYRF
jgi:long-subunit fatty acid transport protein